MNVPVGRGEKPVEQAVGYCLRGGKPVGPLRNDSRTVVSVVVIRVLPEGRRTTVSGGTLAACRGRYLDRTFWRPLSRSTCFFNFWTSVPSGGCHLRVLSPLVWRRGAGFLSGEIGSYEERSS
jgi:hypothetical protein